MFSVNLFNFSKRENSTKRPSGNGLSFSQCQLKNGCSIIAPIMEFNLLLNNPKQYNFCYIEEFNRFYFIEDWYWNNGLWNATMICDVLATYRTEIGNFYGYVLRSASSYDGNIIDGIYPTKATSTYSIIDVNSPLKPTGKDGCFILGVANDQGLFGSIDYYIVEHSVMRSITQYLLGSGIISVANGFNLDDASTELQKSIIDPLSFIKSAMYLPLDYDSLGSEYFSNQRRIKVFDWEMPVDTDGKRITFTDTLDGYSIGTKVYKQYYETSFNITLPKHPQASSRGNYCNGAPYSKYSLNISPFGIVELDANELINATQITCKIIIDFIDGHGILEVYNGTNLNVRTTAQVCVPIGLHQTTSDVVGGVSSIVSGIGDMVGGMISGITGFKGAEGSTLQRGMTGAKSGASGIIGGASGIINGALALATPISSEKGSNGAYADLGLPNKLYCRFADMTDDDITNHGRPLMQMRRLGSLSGYMIVQDGDIQLDATQSESQKVRSYLESGFYYE